MNSFPLIPLSSACFGTRLVHAVTVRFTTITSRKRRNHARRVTDGLALGLCAALMYGCQHVEKGSSLQNAATSPNPSPTVTTRCWIYDQIYPANEKAFEAQKLTAAEQQEIAKWAQTVPPGARAMVRWMRDPLREPKKGKVSFLVFVAEPFFKDGKPIGIAWGALNTNVVIDARSCWVHAYPKA